MQIKTEPDIETNMSRITVTFTEQESVDIRLYCQEHGLDHQEVVDRMLRDAVMNTLYS
jgi:hypothetical protein